MSEFVPLLTPEMYPQDRSGIEKLLTHAQGAGRFDPQLVNLLGSASLEPILFQSEDTTNPSLLGKITEFIRSIGRLAPEEPPSPLTPVNLAPNVSPYRYGLNDAYRNPDVLSLYHKFLPDYAKSYREQIDQNRYPLHINLLPETGLPRYLNGFLKKELDTLDDPKAVQDRADEWLTDNRVLVTGDQTREIQDGIYYVDQVRFRGVADGSRGLETTVSHARYQQKYNDLPVYGGAITLTLTRSSRHLSVTNSIFPVTDGKRAQLRSLVGDEKEASRQRAFSAAKRLLAVDREFTGLGAITLCLHLLISGVDEESWGPQEEALAKKLFAELALYAEEKLTDKIRSELESLSEQPLPARLRTLWTQRARFDIPQWVDEEQMIVASYRGSDFTILPYRDDFHLAWRLWITPSLTYNTWQIFVDAHSGVVLGEPESLAAHLKYVPSSASLAADQEDEDDPDLTIPGLETQMSSIFQMQLHGQQNSTKLGQILQGLMGNSQLARESVNIAVHGLRCLEYIEKKCGVELNRLRPDNDPLTPSSSDILTLIVGSQATKLNTFFNPAKAGVIFQTEPDGGIFAGNRRIHKPSLDPEIVYHELFHAFMWRLNPDPFELQQEIVPFSRALIEGYAIYFARSLAVHAVQLMAADVADSDEHLWARGAYRQSDWQQEWSLFRQADIPGEDFLAFPNLYPPTSTDGLAVYRVGMVWARALWQVRRILGQEITDSTLLSVFPALVGWAISFETAANNFIDALRRREPPIDEAQIDAVIEVFNRRNIAPGHNVFAVAEIVAADGTIICYAGGPRFLRRSVNGAPFVAVDLPESDEIGQGITALAGFGSDLYAATAGKVYHFDGALWRAVVGWPEAQLPLTMHHTGHSLWVGSSSSVQQFTPGTHPHLGTWTEHTLLRTQDKRVSVVAANSFSVVVSGVEHRGICALGIKSTANAYFAAENNPQWRSLINTDPVSQTIGWLLCVAGGGDAVFAGTLAGGLWKQTIAVEQDSLTSPDFWQPLGTPALDPKIAVLCLSFHNGTLFVGTSAGLFQVDEGADSILRPIVLPLPDNPEKEPMIRSLCATDNYLLVGTAHHGVWLRPRNGGNWLSDRE